MKNQDQVIYIPYTVRTYMARVKAPSRIDWMKQLFIGHFDHYGPIDPADITVELVTTHRYPFITGEVKQAKNAAIAFNRINPDY